MKKFITLIFTICICLTLVSVLSACNTDTTHNHTYATEWSYDDVYHWYDCENGNCSNISDKAEHTIEDWKCLFCGYVMDDSQEGDDYQEDDNVIQDEENYGIDNFEFELSEDGTYYICVGYNGSVRDITIPEEYNDLPVKSIGDYAFWESNVKSIRIPDSVTSIGTGAFRNCISLTSVNLGSGVTTIGSEAFNSCNITSIYIPKSVINLGSRVLDVTNSLESIVVEDGNPVYHSDGNCLIETASKKVIGGCKNSVIPADGSVTCIGEYAFESCYDLVSINIPESITRMEDYAFNLGYSSQLCVHITSLESYCNIEFATSSANPLGPDSSLYLNGELVTDLVIPNGVTTIGCYAFSDYGKLKSITIPSSVTDIGMEAFANCTNLTEINFNATSMNDLTYNSDAFYGAGCYADGIVLTIGRNVEKIPAYLFAYNYTNSTFFDHTPKITTVIFDDESRCTSIGTRAFYKCKALESITIPESMKKLDGAFDGCTALNEVHITSIEAWCGMDFGDGSPLYYAGNLYLSGQLVTHLNIPEGVETISKGAFNGCYCIQSVTLPTTMTSIGDQAFELCLKLIEVYNLSQLQIEAGDKNHGYVGFYAKDIYTSSEQVSKLSVDQNGFVLYKNTDTQEYYLLGYTGNETSIALPDTIDGADYEIYDCAFRAHDALVELTIPESVTIIGRYAFSGCTQLTEIVIPNKVTSIKYAAFAKCYGLTSVVVGNGVSNVVYDAFDGCENLKSVVFVNTNGWRVSSSLSATNGTDVVVTDSAQNAIYLTSTYKDLDWIRN